MLTGSLLHWVQIHLVTLIVFGGSAMVVGVKLRFWKPKDPVDEERVRAASGWFARSLLSAKLPVSVVIALTNLQFNLDCSPVSL